MTSRTRMPGLAIGIVSSIDPVLGRVRLRVPWLDADTETDWAPIASAMAGPGRGVYFMPELGDEVVIGFDHGQFDFPYVLGFLWNGKDAPPRKERDIRVIRSVNGHETAICDRPIAAGDRGYIQITDAHGNQIELANGRIRITGIGMVEIKAPVVTINGRVVAPNSNPI
jgi:uncharacterized protein involved in type VI secretion and phage assembly